MPDFWRDSGYHLLARADEGQLMLTDDYLRAFLMRPELALQPESCAQEQALHAAVQAEPCLAFTDEQLTQMADLDAIENWRLFRSFRDQLRQANTIEAAYQAFFIQGPITVPPLFLDQLAHAILHGILEGVQDPLRVRAAELLFRSQRVTVNDGAILLADEEIVELHARTGGFGSLGQLVVEAQTEIRSVELDIIRKENASLYWQRDTKHDMVLDISFAEPGLDALCRVLESWVRHFHAVDVEIQPAQKIADTRWVWHIGLDREATILLNDLYQGKEVEQDRLSRLLSLFRLEFTEPKTMRADIAGRPIYLAMMMNEQQSLRLKPQNLLTNLPLATRS